MSKKTQRRHQTYKHPQYVEPIAIEESIQHLKELVMKQSGVTADNHGPSAVSKALPIIAKTQHFEQYWQDRILRAGRSEESNE